jgi:murein L,D-transpeptidase YcbB/YkuD
MRTFAAKKSLRWLGASLLLLGTGFPVGNACAQDSERISFSAGTDSSSSAQDDIRSLVQGPDSNAAPSDKISTALLNFYAARDFRPAWTDSGSAQSARAALDHAYEQGLRSADYTAPLSRWKNPPSSGRDEAQYDVTLTTSFLRYASDVHNGRFAPKDVYKDVILPPQDFDVAAALTEALARNSLDAMLADLPPPQLGYRGLVDALARYRAIASQGGWPVVPAKAEIALDGSGGARGALIHRLALEDAELAEEPDDENLQVAVLRFQRRHGLDDDGRVGAAMISELNIPAGTRVQQIIANMERWRWLPRNFERRYIRVNVPDQSVEFVRNGKVVLHSKVIIGRKTSPTPILRTAVVGVVANPPWDIPGDIAIKQIVPQMRKNPNYLASRNMVIANGGVQQVPGPTNVLGVLMLDSPNDFDVYLHDTGNRKNFEEKTREMSNGCVRVDQIFALASLAFTDGESDNSDEISEAISTGKTQELQTRGEMPLYLLYWTALAQPDGAVEFRPDRYGRDRSLIAKLAPQGKKPDSGHVPAPNPKLTAR